ncbi:hypothetical protein HUG20_17210 [Salicibibacter cibi]|uniref:Uncharacterized protein n=1 Tax=Salicibibacter cibi TaxID=2743001 RepID=A0A7T7CGX2_9BACI|nr:hypothetical protein [Salicibibacter cibi]QQK81479.1 hypothetical protein HUG20_17210 [Salicibibacter cibi]
MRTILKYILLLLSIFAQAGVIFYVFIDLSQAWLMAGVYVIALFLLFVILITERRKEKREEEVYVNRDY